MRYGTRALIIIIQASSISLKKITSYVIILELYKKARTAQINEF